MTCAPGLELGAEHNLGIMPVYWCTTERKCVNVCIIHRDPTLTGSNSDPVHVQNYHVHAREHLRAVNIILSEHLKVSLHKLHISMLVINNSLRTGWMDSRTIYFVDCAAINSIGTFQFVHCPKIRNYMVHQFIIATDQFY